MDRSADAAIVGNDQRKDDNTIDDSMKTAMTVAHSSIVLVTLLPEQQVSAS